MLLSGTTSAQNLITQGLQSQYESSDKVIYTICYSSPDTVFVSIGLEEKINNDWIELTDDISKESLGSMRIEVMRLANKKGNKVEWVPNSLPQLGKKSKVSGTFRFVYYCGATINIQSEIPQKFYSPIFVVK